MSNQGILADINLMTPNFESLLRGLNPSVAKWVQYTGWRKTWGTTYLTFQSSQSSIGFELKLHGNLYDPSQELNESHDAIYQIFKERKLEVLKTLESPVGTAPSLEKRLACIAQDLECILQYVPEQILDRSTPYADSVRTHFNNIKIACDITSDEADKWNYSPRN